MEQKLSPNFTAGNGTFKPVGFIIHGTLGAYAGAVEWLCTPPEKRTPESWSSAHLVIAKDGRATQLVKNGDIAWHAGMVSNPTEYAKKFLKKELTGKFVNPNSYLIGIENEWFDKDRDSTQQLTSQQLDVMAKFIFDTGIKNPVILLHSEVTDYKADFRKRDGTHDTSIRDEIVKRLAYLTMQVTPVSSIVQQSSAPMQAAPNMTMTRQAIKNKLAEINNLIDTL